MVERAKLAVLGGLQGWRRELIEASQDRRALAAWEPDEASQALMADQLGRAGAWAAMGGHLMVMDEIRDGAVVAMSRRSRAVGLVILDDPPPESFFGGPWQEAVTRFLGRQIMEPEEFYRLVDRFKAQGFTATRLAGDAMKQRAKDVIQQALDGGLTRVEAIRELQAATLGVTPQDAWYLDTVVRTNVATAYGAGRWAQIQSPAVLALRPFVQFRTARDTRVRDAHRALEGLVFASDSPEAANYAPPLGYNCRCAFVTLSSRQVQARSLPVQQGPVDHPDLGIVKPDPGFEGPPGQEG